MLASTLQACFLLSSETLWCLLICKVTSSLMFFYRKKVSGLECMTYEWSGAVASTI